MADLRVYDPAALSMVFGAIIIQGGLADGTFLKVEMKNDAFALKVGADGGAARAKSNDRSAKVTFTLLQSSDANALLSAQHNLDLVSSSGDGIAPLLVKDNNGQTLIAAEHAWITKYSDVEFSKEVMAREWVIETDDVSMLVGGNNAAS